MVALYNCKWFCIMGFRKKKKIYLIMMMLIVLLIVKYTELDANYLSVIKNNYNTTFRIQSSNTSYYKFHFYNINEPPIFNLVDEENKYFIQINGEVTCFIRGTDLQKSYTNCKCKNGYFGNDCGIPAAAWFSYFQNQGRNGKLRRRTTPRRVINGMQVSHEIVMFEARVHELFNIVDVFVIVEASYTDYGDPKPLVFLENLKKGYLKEYQEKIVHIFVDAKPPNATENNWIAHDYMRSFLGPRSLSRISGLREDDIFVINDADEIPSQDIITFLKLYDGYYEHICFRYRWNVYGFFWKPKRNKMKVICSASSIGMLKNNFGNNTQKIRGSRGNTPWVAGTVDHYAGWHCSWCFSPEGIVRKMESAQGADGPRWGDYPEKKNLTYIKQLIHEGRWFDGERKFIPARLNEPMYAPEYLTQNSEKYKSLLFHPGDR